MSDARGKDLPPLDEDQVFEPSDAPAIPLAEGAAACAGFASFDEFWESLGLPETPESQRTKELFFEWLGQHGYDVHRRDEPTILGDLPGWREAWARYLRRRKLR